MTSIWGRGKPTPWDVPGSFPCYMRYLIRAPHALLTITALYTRARVLYYTRNIKIPGGARARLRIARARTGAQIEIWGDQIRTPRALLTLCTNLQPSSSISRIQIGAGDADDVPVLGDMVR